MKKFLGCTAIYICITILTACGWVFFTRPTDQSDASAENPLADEVIQMPEAPAPEALALNNILDGLMTAKALQLDFTVDVVNQDAQPMVLDGQLYLDFSQGFTTPIAQGTLVLSSYTLDFTYQDNWLYITVFGDNYKIGTASILDLVNLITSFTSASQAQPDQQATQFADDLVQTPSSGLDLNQILGELQNLTDRETSDGHELTFTLFGVTVHLNTDLDYHLTMLVTDAITVKNYQITPEVHCAYLDLDELREIAIDADAYTDLSALSHWVDAVANTASLTNWHITATLDVQLTKPVKVPMSIPVDIQIKLINGKPQILAKIGEIPVIVGVNNDVPRDDLDTSGGDNRTLYIYYADGLVYFYRTETMPQMFGIGKGIPYEKKLQITLDEFLADPMVILSYGCGFNDSIMSEITKAMSLAQNREKPIDPGNILKGLTLTPDELTLILNLAELANNQQLNIMTLSLYTGKATEDADDDAPNYVKRGTFAMDFPLSSAFELALKCDDLTLVDIGTDLDWTAFTAFLADYSFINGEPTIKLDERWEARNGNWQMSSALTYTVNFESNGGETVPAVTGPVNTTFDLPTLATWVEDDGVTRDTYTFDGWYTDPEFATESRYTNGVMTRQDLTLYAKWVVESQTYRQVIIINDLLTKRDEFKALPGSQFDLPTSFGDVQAYNFVGWYTDEAYQNAWQGGNIVPDSDLTLYAKWDKVADKRMVTIVDNKFNNQTIILAGFAGDALDLSIYASRYQTVVLDDGTQTKQETYTFAGFDQNLTAFPDSDVTIYVNWDCETKCYYKVTFSKDTDDKKVSVFENMDPSKIDFPFETTMCVLEGTTIDLTPYVPTWDYKKSVLGRRCCDFEGWTTTRNGEAVTQITVTGDTTIYANWSGYHK